MNGLGALMNTGPFVGVGAAHPVQQLACRRPRSQDLLELFASSHPAHRRVGFGPVNRLGLVLPLWAWVLILVFVYVLIKSPADGLFVLSLPARLIAALGQFVQLLIHG
jgi:hypothetical protein